MPSNSAIVFGLSAVSVLILAPILIHRMITFKKMMSSQMIQKRYPKILLLQGIFIVSWLIIGFPIFLIDLASIATTPQQHVLVDRINYSLVPLWSIGIFLAVAWRFWHMFYDLMHSSMQKSNWKNELDPELESQQDQTPNQFYVTNGATYGSKQWTKNKVIAIYIVTVFIVILFYQLFIETSSAYIAHFISFAVHVVIVAIALRLAFLIPAYHDNYFVRQEMKLTLYQLLIAPGFAAIAVACFIVTASMSFMLALCTIGTIMVFNVSMVSFWWIPKKIATEESNLKAYQDKVEDDKGGKDDNEIQFNDAAAGATGRRGSEIIKPEDGAVKEIVRRLSISAQGRRASLQLPHAIAQGMAQDQVTSASDDAPLDVDEKEKAIHLAGILYDDKTFGAFMNNLAKDFSTEYLLCFVEIMQFKFLMKERFDKINADALRGTDQEFDIEFPFKGIAPLSEINKNGFKSDLNAYKEKDDPQQLMNESKAVAFKIYKKYLETGAEFKIKILEETKKTLDNLLKNEAFFMNLNTSAEQLFCIYDETVGEVWSVMNAFPTFQTACQSLNIGDS